MKNIIELEQAVLQGRRPIVTFLKGISDKDEYAEPGMRARVLSVVHNRHDAEVYEVNFDYGCFDAHNLQFELPTYYDKSGNPCLTARQAGRYKPHDSIYFDTGEDLSTLLAIESDQVSALYARYLEEAGSIAGLTYVQWLEAKVLGFPVSG